MPEKTGVRLKLNNSELWGGLIGLALGIFVIRSGIKLKLGTINDPGSGYVLFYTGILMCLFALTHHRLRGHRGRAQLRFALGGRALDQAADRSSHASPHFPSRWSRSASCSPRSR